MNITIFPDLKNAEEATGLAVVIDVFRAFSVEVYIFQNGARAKTKTRCRESLLELSRKLAILLFERLKILYILGSKPPDLIKIASSPQLSLF